MKRIARILTCISAGISILTLIHPRPGLLSIVLWYPKLVAGAWSPVLALLGGLGSLLGFACGDFRAAGIGLLGATIAARYVANVMVPHRAFEETFGPGWQKKISPEPAGCGQCTGRRQLTPARPPQESLHRKAEASRTPVERDVVYGNHASTGEPLKADIWLPPPHVPRTGLAILYLFGGAWHYMNRTLWTGTFLHTLASKGHVVMNVGYTQAPQARLPAMIGDVKQAIARIKSHGDQYSVDPDRVILMGVSSGAHLALLAAYTPNHPDLQPATLSSDTSVRAVVSYSGFTDLRSTHTYFESSFGQYFRNPSAPERWILAATGWLFRRHGILPVGNEVMPIREVLPSLLGGSPNEVPDQYRLGSPIEHVGPQCPPTLLLQGAHDYNGLGPDVWRLHHALGEVGVPSVCIEYPDTDHAFELLTMGAPCSPAARAAIRDTDCFLALMA
jgi:acetyl esterase/lipase